MAATTAGSPRAAALYRLGAATPGSPAARPDPDGWRRFAGHAEGAGIESVLISFSRYEPEPLLTACALGRDSERLGLIVAYRSGLALPATFVQQLNTLSTLVRQRISINVVAGSSKAEQQSYGDFLEHDERYARAEEFLAVCRAFWSEPAVDFEGRFYRVEGGHLHTPFVGARGGAPEIYVSGHSEPALDLARSHGSCWLRVADAPERLAPRVAEFRQLGLDVCLRMGVICRPTREEAVEVARSLLPDGDEGAARLPQRDDSLMYRQAAAADPAWPTPSLWTGLAPHYGPVWTTLLGTPQELADALLAWGRIGVGQFILHGWPEIDEVEIFGREVLPRVRAAERAASPAAASLADQ